MERELSQGAGMDRHRTYPVITSPAEMRAAARRGEWHGSTGGQCSAYQQANLVILPQEAAVEFAAFCTRNPKPCRQGLGLRVQKAANSTAASCGRMTRFAC